MLQRVIVTLAILVVLPSAASAGSFKYYGPHLGFGQGPDQTVLGGQLQWNGVAPHLAFVPSIDYGFNDRTSVVSLNADFHYQLTYDTAWQPYVGFGAGIHRWSDSERPSRNATEPGGHLIVGAAVHNGSGGRFFTELKLGMGNGPDMMLVAGMNLRGN